jgi:transposase
MGPDTRQTARRCAGSTWPQSGAERWNYRTQGFQVLQWRWIVERTFGWLNRSRRLSKDFEALPETTEAWIRIAMIQVMIRRLAAKK